MQDQSTAAFIAHARAIGIAHLTLNSPKLADKAELAAAQAELAQGGPSVNALTHPFAIYPNLAQDSGKALAGLLEAIAIAQTLGASTIYLITGGRGALDWEAAAARFAKLVAPARALAEAKNIRLLVENANAFNALLTQRKISSL